MHHLTQTLSTDSSFASDYGCSDVYNQKLYVPNSFLNYSSSLDQSAGSEAAHNHIFDEDEMLGALDAEIYNPIDSILMEQPDGRVSLAFERLTHIPRPFAETFAQTTHTLDLSHNQIKNLSFLTNFRYLNTLILDQNTDLAEHTFPVLPALRILWLNNCDIRQPTVWLRRLQIAAPHLRQLSLFGNPGCRSLCNGGTSVEARAYRRLVVAALPGLQHLDDAHVTEAEREEATAAHRQSASATVVIGGVFVGAEMMMASTTTPSTTSGARLLALQQQRRVSQHSRDRVVTAASATTATAVKRRPLQQQRPLVSTTTTSTDSSH